MSQNSYRDSDVYVSTADLSISLPPPNRRAGIREIIQHPLTVQILSLAYMLLIIFLWINVLRAEVEDFLVQDAPPVSDEVLTTLDAVEEFFPSQGGLTTFISNLQAPEQKWHEIYTYNETPSNTAEGLMMGFLAALPFGIFVIVRSIMAQFKEGIPFYRNIIFVRDFTQVVFLMLILAFAYALINNLTDNLADSGLIVNFKVLSREYSVAITEGPDYQSELTFLDDIPLIGGTLSSMKVLEANSNVRALLTGLVNTLRVVSISLVFATILGVFVGVGLLSTNWLVRNVSRVYVEIFRNTPLLVQIFFIYKTYITILPQNLQNAHTLPGPIYIHGRGIDYPKITPTNHFIWFAILAIIGIVVGYRLWKWRLSIQDRTGMPANTMQWFLGAFFSFALVGLNLAFIQSLVVESNKVLLMFLVIGGIIFAAGAAFWYLRIMSDREAVKQEHTVIWFLGLLVVAAVVAANIGYLTTKLYVLRREQVEFFGVVGRSIRYPVQVGFGDRIGWFLAFAAIGLLLAFQQWYKQTYTSGNFNGNGDATNAIYIAGATFVGFALVGSNLAFVMNNLPLDIRNPVLGRFNFEGGSRFTAEFIGLGLSLVLYTAAFIADIVRAGIQSVPKGQIEAARAAGLSNGQTLRMVVLPQAMRLIIPPLTNQYLNLSKNSSLAIAIGFYDLYNVGTIAGNQSGQVVVFFTFILVTYLLLSLIISLFMNTVNRSLRLRTR